MLVEAHESNIEGLSEEAINASDPCRALLCLSTEGNTIL